VAAKIYLIAAARPNFMKIAPLWRALQEHADYFTPYLIHTGQHYDRTMSEVFLRELGLPDPHVHLGVGSGTHAEQTGRVMMALEKLCLNDRPDLVLVVGDVNSTMAATLAAKKLCIPVGHIEAGLRSRDWQMPEEINRIVTDAVSDLLFTPSADADENLRAEGVAPERIYLVGNIMIDTLVQALPQAKSRETCRLFGKQPRGYALITLHRPVNVDDPEALGGILARIQALDFPVVFPVHPRTRKVIEGSPLAASLARSESRIMLSDPLGYLDFLSLILNARFVLTDSGGIQEETTYLGIPCLTLRTTTERPITITQGTNELVTLADMQAQAARILAGNWKQGSRPPLWDGATAPRIATVLKGWHG